MTTKNPLVSIIIPTYNNERTIDLCLKSIKNQSYNNIETIVVDDYSNDATFDICKDYPVQFFQKKSGRAEARIFGSKKASGKYIYHVDSDMELSKDVVGECVNYCENREFDALLIPEKNIGKGYWSKCLKFGKMINKKNEQGNLRFLRRELYEEVGRHDPNLLSGEDKDLHISVEKTEASIGHIDNIVKHHIEDMGLNDILMKSKKYAETSPKFLEKNRSVEQKSIPKQYLDNLDIFLEDIPHAVGYFFISFCTALFVRFHKVKDNI